MRNNKKDVTVNSEKSTIPTTRKTVDGMTYKTLFFFSKKSKETFRDKLIRLGKNVANQSS